MPIGFPFLGRTFYFDLAIKGVFPLSAI